jgi:mannose-6-phosphate isomerase-like protein (cupin superfamily)
MRLEIRRHASTVMTGALALGLALGWSAREAQWAKAAGKRIPNATVNLADVQVKDADYEGKPTGKAAVLLDGETPSTRSMQVGRFLLNPGTEPHPPHQHVDEEILIVSKGAGEVYCGGKTVAVKPGAVMYADPNVEHGIKNTGQKPLEFYWIKYVPQSAK